MKKGLYIVILAVLLGVAGFTYISYRNYIKDLAVVSLTDTAHNQLRSELKTMGSLYYNELLNVTFPHGCLVEEVFVSEGDTVEADTPLFRVRVADLQIIRLNKQLQIDDLGIVEKLGGTEGELAYWEKVLLLEEIAELETLIAAEGVVKAEGLQRTNETVTSEGAINKVRVIKQTYKVGDLTKMDVPIVLGLPEGGCYLEWQVSAKDYKEYKGSARIREKKEELTWETPHYSDGIYTYQSQVPIPENFVHGEQVQIMLNYISEDYPAVIPKSCIRTDTDGSTYVYQVDTRRCNYGEEQYVKKVGVTIVEQDATRAAIKAELSGIVLGSSKQLQDMMAAIVIEK